MLTCGLYCLLRFPETSSAHGITRRLNTGLPFATFRTGFGPKSFQTFSTRHLIQAYSNSAHLGTRPDLVPQFLGTSAVDYPLEREWSLFF